MARRGPTALARALSVSVATLLVLGGGLGPARALSAPHLPAPFALPATGTAGGLRVVGSAPVGFGPQLAMVNAANGEVDVANTQSGNVSVLQNAYAGPSFDVAANGTGPYDLLFNPVDTDALLTYHSYPSPHQVSLLCCPGVLGGLPFGSVKGITSDDEPALGAYDAFDGLIYLTDDGTTVGAAVVNASNETRYATASTGAGPRDLSVDAANGWAYVADLGSSSVTYLSGLRSIGTVAVPPLLNTSTSLLHVGSTLFPMYYASQIAFDPSDHEAYVADAGAAEVSVLSGSSSAVVANVSAGGLPYSVAYDPADGEVYAADVLSDTVTVLSGTSVLATLSVGAEPVDVAYDAQDGDMLVANLNSSNVSVLNGTTVVGSLAVGVGPNEVVYDAVDHDAYVVNYVSHNVTVLGPPSSGGGGSGVPPWAWGLLIVVVLVLVLLALLLGRRRRGRQPSAAGNPPASTGTPSPPAALPAGSPPPPSGGGP